jgi:competence protein ComEC
VAKFTYKESTLLLPGDLYVSGESSVLERYGEKIQSDIMKMSHHGDDTSNTPTFIKTIKPKIAVAEFDRLASLSVYNSYRKNGAEAYITAIDGNVRITMDGTRNYEVLTEKGRIGDFLK